MKKEFLSWVRSEMKRMGLTQKRVAGKTLTRQQISMILNGHSEPGQLFFLAVSKAFNMPIDELYARAGIATGGITNGETDLITRKMADLTEQEQADVEGFVDYLRWKKTQKDDEEQDLIDRADKLSEPARRRMIDAGDELARQKRKKKDQANNHVQPEPVAIQSPLL